MADDKSFTSGKYCVSFKATQAALMSSVKLFLMSGFMKFIVENNDLHYYIVDEEIYKIATATFSVR